MGLGASILFMVALVVMALLTHHGRLRAAIIACALPLGLVPMTLTVAYGSRALINTFSGMALSGTGGMAAVTGECQRVWTLVRMGAGAFAVVAVVAALLGSLPLGSRADAPACSARRGLVLLLLPLAGAVLASGLAMQLRSAVRVANAVVVDDRNDAARSALVEKVLASEGLGGATGGGGIAAISQHIARRVTVGTLGGLAAVVALVGLSLTGALIAAPIRVSAAFVASASVLWLAVILAAGGVALGAGDPLRLG
jgi:hypothetical protein